MDFEKDESDEGGSGGGGGSEGCAIALGGGGSVGNSQHCCEDFECGHFGHSETGDGYANHCSVLLWSRHVDVMPGPCPLLP